ncbi:MAG: tRNA pseudouridine(13) synthase TruD [Nanobdellota archaeon]
MPLIKHFPEDFIVEEVPNYEFFEAGRYAYFLLEKRNYTTLRALDQVARVLRVPLKHIGYAGIKDKHALTKQYISVPRGKPFAQPDLSLTFVGYRDTPLSLGDLWGNAFTLVVRGLEHSPVQQDTFVNYFGEQRFSHSNAEIGKAMVTNDFARVTELLLQGHGEYEDRIRKHLKKRPRDHIGALRQLPEKLLLLFVHSYQSLLWNRLAQRVVEKEIEVDSLPLLGFDTDIDDPRLFELVQELLEEEGVGLRNFIIRKIPSLTCEGGWRDLYKRLHDLSIGDLEVDEVTGAYKSTITFKLEKGAYATEAITSLCRLS